MIIKQLMSTGILCFFMALSPAAQEEIENLYLRKAVKDYVAREYDNTIGDLEQVLAANPKNERARKLLAKVYVLKGQQAAAQNNLTDAIASYGKAGEYDAANLEAQKGLLDLKQRQVAAKQATVEAQQQSAANPSQGQAAAPAQQQPYVFQQAPPTIIQTPQAGTDTVSARVIQNLLSSFNENQKVIAHQIDQTNSMVNHNDSSKDKYLEAIMGASRQNDDKLLRYIVIGGGIAAVFLIIFVAAFFLFIHSVNKNADLRTVQATQTFAALLAGPAAAQAGGSNLLLTAPSQENQNSTQEAQQAPQESEDKDILQLSDPDPLKRADAVEAVEREYVKSKDKVGPEKIKKMAELLNDENNRVRANAAKAMYHIDKEASLSTLDGILKNSSKRMRASGIWAMGEIGSQEVLDLLLTIPNEADEMIAYNVKTALEKIKNGNRFPITSERMERIEAELQKYKEMV